MSDDSDLGKWSNAAYVAGWDAGMFSDLDERHTNPYPKGTDDYEIWWDGFYLGRDNWDMNIDDGG